MDPPSHSESAPPIKPTDEGAFTSLFRAIKAIPYIGGFFEDWSREPVAEVIDHNNLERNRVPIPRGSQGPSGDDISFVGALLGEHTPIITENDVNSENTLRGILSRDDDTTVSDLHVQNLIDSIQRVAKEPTTVNTQNHSQITLRVLRQLVEKTGKPPSQIILSDVECHDRRTYGTPKGTAVYCGTRNGNKVAIKHLRVFGMAKPSKKTALEKIFVCEGVLWYNLSHIHVMPFLGLVNLPELQGLCMVFPWMENGNARQYLDQAVQDGDISGRNAVNTVDKLLHETSLGLAFLHNNGVVHGELCGAHIYIDDKARARLANYGLSPITDTGSDFSASLQVGSGAWLAPELIDPERFGLNSSKSTPETDMYAFGILCVELYTRQTPFQDLSDIAVARKTLKGDRPKRPKAPEQSEMTDELWSITTRCWKEAPSERPSANQVAGELGALAHG